MFRDIEEVRTFFKNDTFAAVLPQETNTDTEKKQALLSAHSAEASFDPKITAGGIFPPVFVKMQIFIKKGFFKCH